MATALGLLLASFLGETSSAVLLGLIAVLGVAARVEHPFLLIVASAGIAANVLVLPDVVVQSASGAVAWRCIPLWCLQGLLINWLLVVLFRATWEQPAKLGASSATPEAIHANPEAIHLLTESSSQSQERVRLMVESIRDYAIVMLDPEGRVSSWNIGAERIFGYRASEILGRSHVHFYVSEEIVLEIPRLSLETALAKGTFAVEGWRRRKDRTRLWAHVGVTSVRSATGALLGFATIIRDMTEKKRAEESLRLAHDELEIRVRDRTAELADSIRALQAEVQERIQAQEILQKQSEVLRSILDSIGDAIVVAGGEGTSLTINPAARDLFGIGPDPLTIEHWLSLEMFKTVDSADSSPSITATEGPISRVLRGEKVDDLELIVRPPGSDACRWVLANGRPPRDQVGERRGAVVAFRDITDLRRYAQELKAAKDAAESASHAKDQFLAILSHELRTPLTPVLLAASGLLEGPDLGADVRVTVAMIRRNAELEARLIDDLLDLTHATTGRMTLSLASVDLHHVIRHATEICRANVEEAQLELRLELGASRHHLSGDSARLQQVFWNLIKNAVKFTPRGGRITIRTWNPPGPGTGPQEARFLAEVSDTGIGIESNRLPRVFNAFEQKDPEHQRTYGGLGLGLAISRSILEAHGGRLTASSAGKGRGAEFTIELATGAGIRASAVLDEHPTATPCAGPRPEGLRILLIDDNRDTLHYLAGVLRQRGHHVNPAFNFRTASSMAESNGYDLVISDIELPDGSGLDIMRGLATVRPTPGIALSGFGTEDDVAMSLEAGFAEHLTKPIDVGRLDAAIARVALKHGAKDRSYPPRDGIPD